jgi:DNA-binding response OmpR family regulator
MIKHKILLAEDDLFLGKLSQKKFEMSDFSVLFLKDGMEVLNTAKKEKPEAIVLDLIMPNKDGFQVLAELKADEETKNIPVVVVSALGSEEDMNKVLALGAKKYFIKSNVQLSEIIKYLQALVA